MGLFSIDAVSGWISNRDFIDADSALITSHGSVFSLQVQVCLYGFSFSLQLQACLSLSIWLTLFVQVQIVCPTIIDRYICSG